MPQKIVEEWSEFLDDEKIINIQYHFTTAFLCEKTTEKKEIKELEKDYKTRKEGLVRQVESTKTYIEQEVDRVNKFKLNLEEVKKDIEKQFGKGSEEFKKLQKYEELKTAITQDMEKQRVALFQKIDEIDQKIKREGEKYVQLLKQVNIGKSLIAKEKSDEVELDNKEKGMHTKLESLKTTIESIQKEIEYEKKVHSIQDDMKGFFGKMKDNFERKKMKNSEMEKKKYYKTMSEASLKGIFQKLISETKIAILKKDIEQSRELFVEMRSCYTAIKESNLDDSIKSSSYENFYDIYTQVNSLYKQKSYDDTKAHIDEKLANTTKQLGDVKKGYEEIQKTITNKKKNVEFTKNYIKKFDEYINSFSKNIGKTKKTLEHLLVKKGNLDKKVTELEKGVMGKVLKKRGKFDDSIKNDENVSKYQKLFEKKAELERLIQRINHDKNSLEEELRMLIKKAKSIEITQSKDMNMEIEEVQNLLQDINVRKKEFENEVQEFNEAIKGE